MDSSEKIKKIGEIAAITEELRDNGKKIVFTNGCFDILHVGHVRYLKEAREQGDALVIGLNSDSSVKKIKGNDRPINNENDRAEVLAALECVDYVVIFNENNPVKLIEKIRPNVHVKGGDWKSEQLVEKTSVEKYGGKIYIARKYGEHSTSRTIEKIKGD